MRASLLMVLALTGSVFAVADASASSTCDPTRTACATDSNYADGSCDQGGSQLSSTVVNVGQVEILRGESICSGTQESDDMSIAEGMVQWGHLHYDDPDAGSFDGCYLYVLGQFTPCPANPPNPGWGHLLP